MERFYRAFYRNRSIDTSAESSLDAQMKAQTHFKARKRYDITVVLLDKPLDVNGI